MGCLGIPKIRGCEPQAFLDLALQRVLESIRMFEQPLTIGIRAIPCAKHAKRNLGRSEVGLCLLDDAAERFKGLAVSIHYHANARVEGHSSKVLEPGHAHTLEVAVERPREAFTRLVDRK